MKTFVSVCAILALTFVGCRKNLDAKISQLPKPTVPEIVEKTNSDSLEEHYVDSTKIGIPGKFKVELSKFRNTDDIYAIVQFFEKSQKNWKLKQEWRLEKDGVTGCDPEFADFNNDGNGDFTFKNAVAARGANDVRLLFVFDPKTLNLVLIKNSDAHPNLRYNRELRCVEGFHVYGGSMTCFLKIEADSLREFANVETFDETLTVTKIDKNGKSHVTLRKKFEESYVRFKNFDPVEEYPYDAY